MNAENNTATTNGMTALDYGGLALSGAGSIASIYSAIKADREAKRRAKLEAEQLQMQKDQQQFQNNMAQQQVARQIQTQNALLPSIQNAESMNTIQNLLNLYNAGNRTSVAGA